MDGFPLGDWEKTLLWWVLSACVTNLSQWEGGEMKAARRQQCLSHAKIATGEKKKPQKTHRSQLKGSVFGVDFSLSLLFFAVVVSDVRLFFWEAEG